MSGIAIAGLVVGVVGTAVSVGMSVDAANKQKAAKQRAEADAKKAMDAARRKMEQRTLAGLAVNLEGERTAAENQAVVAATSIDVARKGDPRQLAATVGRTQMAQIKEQEALQAVRAKRVDDLELLKAQEEAQIRDQLAGLDLAEAEGAQMAASDAAKMAAQYEQQALTSGIEGVANIGQQAVAVGGAVQSANTGAARIAAEKTMAGDYDPSMMGPPQAGQSAGGIPALTEKYGSYVPSQNQTSFQQAVSKATTLDEWLSAYYNAGGQARFIQ
jgi:hypothetical protein|tara:strand:+ start:1617 stop:2435 length:819 start_codon:yes stop_codon:yes gene_type:complete